MNSCCELTWPLGGWNSIYCSLSEENLFFIVRVQFHSCWKCQERQESQFYSWVRPKKVALPPPNLKLLNFPSTNNIPITALLGGILYKNYSLLTLIFFARESFYRFFWKIKSSLKSHLKTMLLVVSPKLHQVLTIMSLYLLTIRGKMSYYILFNPACCPSRMTNISSGHKSK